MVESMRDDSVHLKESSARRLLEGYRERRRHRRGEDTYFGSAELFLDVVNHGLSSDDLDNRRSSILLDAERDGVPLDLAELLYDIALEEGLDPALAYELVRTGLGVEPPADGLTTAPTEPVADRYLPAWMFPASAPDNVLRERMLRVSFRRIRSLLEDEADPDEAFRQFANQPDVGHFGY